METKTIYTKAYGIEKGYLSDREVYLKPVPKGNKMITDPNHIGYFMWEGASKLFCLPQNSYSELVNPFKSEDEQKFFEELLDLNLSIHKKEDNFWHGFFVSITKNYDLMSKGIKYNLSDPMDALRVKVLSLQKEVAPSWEQRFEHMAYQFALVPEDFEDKTNSAEMNIMEEIFTYWGSIKDSPKKMKEFLSAYHMSKKSNKEVPEDSTREFLSSEIKKIIDKDKEVVHSVITDKEFSTKLFILKAIRLGTIVKEGVGTYYITGEGTRYQLDGFIEHIKYLKDTTDPIYMKIEAQINSKKA